MCIYCKEDSLCPSSPHSRYHLHRHLPSNFLSPIFDCYPIMSNRVGWEPEPNSRGTLGLLSSCFGTLLICVYNAVHINVPCSGARHIWFYQNVRKAKWVFVGVFTPELLALTAFLEYRRASQVCKLVDKYIGDEEIRVCLFHRYSLHPFVLINDSFYLYRTRKPTSVARVVVSCGEILGYVQVFVS